MNFSNAISLLSSWSGEAFFGKAGNDRTDLLNGWSPFLGKGGAGRASESLA